MKFASKLKTVFQKPDLILWEMSRLYHRRVRNRQGISIMSEDWDNLIILDACRYDMFVRKCNIDGELRSVVSQGSSTAEFFNENFVGKSFADTVYVSANPQFERFKLDGNFHHSAKLWENHWNKNLSTVPPEPVAQKALEFGERYPNKRLLVHFLQPHYPFIGDVGKSIEHRSVTGGGTLDRDESKISIWKQLKRGDVSESKVREAYNENLDLVLPYVTSLVEELHGKSIITSDHGNAFGRWGVYGHPSRRFLRDLVEVPWLTFESDKRKDIKEDSVGAHESTDADVQERLEDLGYM